MNTPKNKSWKLDMDIYDRPGWNSFTYNYPIWGGIRKKKNNEIVIRFDTADAGGLNDDFYFEHYRQVVLSSKDGGISWEEIEPDWKYNIPLELSDGTLLEMLEEDRMQTREEIYDRLKKRGLGYLWNDDCKLGWDLWPTEMTEQLKQQQLTVFAQRIGPTPNHVYLPEGVVAVHAPSAFIIRKSTDGGKTWREFKVAGIDTQVFSHLVCCLPGAAVLSDDTILIPCYGIKKKRAGLEKPPEIDADFWQSFVPNLFVLRSQDKGETWQSFDIDSSGENGFNETCVVAHPSGRVIALIRSGKENNIYKSISDNQGASWSIPQETGMRGLPMNAICLKSGNILCVYTRRWHPAGVRACLSYDAGKTWDIKNEKILRDSSLPSSYNGGPGSVQLDDGTIFTFYGLVKITTPRENDKLAEEQQLVLNPRYHCYITGSKYTEDYVKPLPSF